MGARTLGQPYITWPWLDPDSRSIDKFKLLAAKLNYHLEQGGNFAKDSMMSISDSAAFMKQHLEKYW